jgi:hypothetical protein
LRCKNECHVNLGPAAIHILGESYRLEGAARREGRRSAGLSGPFSGREFGNIAAPIHSCGRSLLSRKSRVDVSSIVTVFKERAHDNRTSEVRWPCLFEAFVIASMLAIDAAMPALTSALAHLLNDEALPLGGASLNVFGELLGDSSTVEPRTLTPLAPVHITRHFRVSQFRE